MLPIFIWLMPLTDERDSTESLTIGLKKLTEQDIENISLEAFQIAERNLSQKVSEREMAYFEIEIEIDNSKDDLQIIIDIIYNPSRHFEDKNQIIQDTLKESFCELDDYLKEKYCL